MTSHAFSPRHILRRRPVAPLVYSGTLFHPSRRIRPWRWEWSVSDGTDGPVLASGTTFTERGAGRRIVATVARCERRTEPAEVTAA